MIQASSTQVARLRAAAALLGALAEGVVILDPDGNVAWTNAAARRIARARFGDDGRLVTGRPLAGALSRLVSNAPDLTTDRRIRRRRAGGRAGPTPTATDLVATTIDARDLAIGRWHRALFLREQPTNGAAHLATNGLSPREGAVARLAARDWSNPDIARELAISPETVKRHLSSVYRKLGLSSRRELRDRGGADAPLAPTSGARTQ